MGLEYLGFYLILDNEIFIFSPMLVLAMTRTPSSLGQGLPYPARLPLRT